MIFNSTGRNTKRTIKFINLEWRFWTAILLYAESFASWQILLSLNSNDLLWGTKVPPEGTVQGTQMKHCLMIYVISLSCHILNNYWSSLCVHLSCLQWPLVRFIPHCMRLNGASWYRRSLPMSIVQDCGCPRCTMMCIMRIFTESQTSEQTSRGGVSHLMHN